MEYRTTDEKRVGKWGARSSLEKISLEKGNQGEGDR